jgi:hypothetical protein
MAYGEQAALVGLLASLKPQLSLELGTYQGGSLTHIAAHSAEVHSFDLASHTSDKLPNVTYHIGDTRTTVPRVLGELARERRNVDFALVDADHSREGVETDMTNLLRSPAVRQTIVLLHDCANEAVREGARRAIGRASGIAYADLSFVGPATRSSLLAEAWGGLGIVVVDPNGTLWQLQRHILENVQWRTSERRSMAWNALSPARAAKRELLYRTRPLYRRLTGTRGAPLR